MRVAARAPGRSCLAGALVCLFATEGRSQAPAAAEAVRGTARIEGVVTDRSSQRLALVRVTLLRPDGAGLARVPALTEADGSFVFERITPERHLLRFEKDGYRRLERSLDRLGVAQTARVVVVLEPLGFRDEVDVVARTPMIDARRTGQGRSLTDHRLLEDPSDVSRDPLAAATWVPGVEAGGASALGSPGRFSAGGMGSLRANGARASQSTFLLDGVDNTSAWRGNARQTLRSDFVREIAVTPFGGPAESPQGPGVLVDVMTRSGTNALHGSVWGVGGDPRLNANAWARNRTLHDPALSAGQRQAAGRPEDARRFVGFTLGGPIRRDRTYFFFGLERTSDRDAFFYDETRAPTAAMAHGDFSAIPGLLLVDPVSRQAFPGNVIPAGRIDPVARQLVSLIPTVGAYGDRYRWSGSDSLTGYDALLRIDHSLSPAHALGVSYVGTWSTAPQSDAAGNRNPFWAGYVDTRRVHTVALRHRWSGAGRSLSTALSYGGSLSDRDNRSPSNRSLSAMGANWPDAGGDVEGPLPGYLPQLTVAGGLGGQPGALDPVRETRWRGTTTLAWQLGSHLLGGGVVVERTLASVSNRRDQSRLVFDGRFTSGAQGNQAASGDNQYAYGFADLLLGRAASFGISARLEDDVSQWSHAAFVQDQWRATRRLTVNAGLRWSRFGPPRQSDGRLSSFVPGHRSDQYPNLPLHMAVAGDAGVPSGMYRPSWTDFAPRAHAAYALNAAGTAVLRLGAGLYHGDPPLGQKMMLSDNEPFHRSLNGSNSKNLVDPWASSYPKGVPLPFELSPSGASYKPGQRVDVSAVDPGRFRTPWSVQSYLSLETRLARGVSAEIAAVRSRGHDLVLLLDRNAPRPDSVGTSSLATEIDKRRPFGAPYRQVREISPVEDTRYDVLHLSLITRTRVLFCRAIYSLQSSTSALGILSGGDSLTDPRPVGTVYEDLSYFQGEEGSRHVARLMLSASLPRPRRKALRALLGGWQLTATAGMRSGRRLTASAGRDLNFDGIAGAGSDRPDQNGPVAYPDGVQTERGDVVWFDRTAFAQVPAPDAARPYPLGTSKVGAIVGPWAWDTGLGVGKQVMLPGRARMQLRLTVSNVFNHANLADPVTNMASPDFGLITTRYGNRRMQGLARLTF